MMSTTTTPTMQQTHPPFEVTINGNTWTFEFWSWSDELRSRGYHTFMAHDDRRVLIDGKLPAAERERIVRREIGAAWGFDLPFRGKPEALTMD